MKVSALWITKNEEANIGRSIQSVLALSDEIVVVDTGSTDATVEIAKGLGARVESFEWINDFSAARNYAMSKVDGDILIFLDADEWFEPALTKADRGRLERSFDELGATHITVRRDNFDPVFGLTVAVDKVNRILKGGGVFVYEGIIHERPVYQYGGLPRADLVEEWTIRHSGYNREISTEKLNRNLALLKKAVEDRPDDVDNAVNHVYLVREQFNMGKFRAAFEALQWLLARPKLYQQSHSRLKAVHLDVFIKALKLCTLYRGKTSRRQVLDVLVAPNERFFADNPLSRVIRLLYREHLDNREPVLLAELEPAVAKAEKLRQGRQMDMGDYFNACGQLYTAAGVAQFRRGNRESAFDYAGKALQSVENTVNIEGISLLLRCTRGLPYADVIRYLNQVMSVEKRGTQEIILSCCQYEGYQDLYTYYCKRALDAGWAKKADFWYLMIVLGKCEEAAQAAFEAQTEDNQSDVQKTLFLAIACGGGTPMLEKYRGCLGRFEGMLDCFFTGKVQERVDFGVMISCYQLIAFAAGRRPANAMAALVSQVDRRMFIAQADYYMKAGLYAELLEEKIYQPQETDGVNQAVLAECEMMIGREDLALQRIERTLQLAEPNENMFNLLSAIAVRAQTQAVRAAADALYAAYHEQFEEMTDWQDLVITGYLPGEELRKERKALAAMAPAQFAAQIQPAGRPPLCNQLSAARKAAMVYLERGFLGGALNCLCRVLQYGPDSAEAYAMLEQVFQKLGNAQLAAFAASKNPR